jgi:tetratricopeptide (TPR) repeat protein
LNRIHFTENGVRLKMSQLALVSMTDYPLTGYGPGNFEIAYQRHAFPTEEAVRYGRSTACAHNDYLQAGSELGWPAAVFLSVWFFVLLVSPIRPNQTLGVPAKAILSALGVAAFFNPISKMPLLGYLAIFSASCLARPRDEDPAPLSQGMKLLFRWIPVVALFPVLWCGFRFYWADRQEWRRILNVNPHDAEAWHNLAYATSNSQEGLKYHERAVLESPYQIYYIEALARSLESIPGQEGISPAIEAYLKAIRLAPTRATNYLSIARLLWRAGEPREALQWTDRAGRLEPNYWECDLWRARCLEHLGDKSRARAILNSLIERHEYFLRINQPHPDSPYEETILAYDRSVIENELSHLPAS